MITETGNLYHLTTMVTPGEQRTRPPVVDIKTRFTKSRVIFPTEDTSPGRKEGRMSVQELKYTEKLIAIFNDGLSVKLNGEYNYLFIVCYEYN